jgi:hypothetical protein
MSNSEGMYRQCTLHGDVLGVKQISVGYVITGTGV